MAANGTPQSALYNRRPQGTDYARDRSMEQYYTPSGNPYGYIQGGNMYRTPVPNIVPYDGNGGSQGGAGGGYGGYTPPQIGGGQWGAQQFAPRPNGYNLPSANGTGFGNGQYTPGYQPPPYMPNFQGYQQAYQNFNNFNNSGMVTPQGYGYQPQYNPQGYGGYQQQAQQDQQTLAAQVQYQSNQGLPTAAFQGAMNPQYAPQAQNVSQMAAAIGGVQNYPAYQGLQAFANLQPQGQGAAYAPQFNSQPSSGNPTADAILGRGGNMAGRAIQGRFSPIFYGTN